MLSLQIIIIMKTHNGINFISLFYFMVVNCADIGNPTCSFTEDQCTAFGNVPFDCPVLCGFCPGKYDLYMNGYAFR